MKRNRMSEIKASVSMYHVLLYLELFDRASIRIQDPFVHGSDSWNFSIAPSGRAWTRFGDEREQGSVIDFYARVKDISPAEAAEELDTIFAVTAEYPKQKGFLTEKLKALRELIGENPDVEELFIATVKASYRNGKGEGAWPGRFARYLTNGLQGVYERALKSRKPKARKPVEVAV